MVKSAILTEVAERTERRTSDIRDAELNSALLALTMAIPSLVKECYTSTASGLAYYDLGSFTNRLRFLQSVVIESSNRSESCGLSRMSDFAKYKAILADEQTADYDTPTQYIVNGDELYLFPTPDDTYTLRLIFSALENDIDSISSNSVYFEPLVDRGCYEVYKNRGMARTEEASGHLNAFLEWVRNFSKIIRSNETASQVVYTDI